MNEQDLDGLMQVLTLLQPLALLTLFAGIVLLSVLVRVIRRSGETLSNRFPARRLLILQSINVIAFVIYMAGGMALFFGILSPPRELMIAVAGGLAVAVGLSLKDIVASLVAGVILLFDRPFNVGDRVRFQGEYGEITSIGLRAVRLQTLNDDTVTIPNSKFITDAVASANFGQLTMLVAVELYLHPTADLERARDIAYEVAVTSRYAFVGKPVIVTFGQTICGDLLATKLTVKVYVIDVVYEKALETDLVLRCSKAFNAAGLAWVH